MWSWWGVGGGGERRISVIPPPMRCANKMAWSQWATQRQHGARSGHCYTPHQPRIRQDKSCTIRKDWRSRCAEGGAGFIRNVLPLTLSGICLCLVAKTESPPLPLPCPEAVGMMSWCHAARLAASAARQNVKFVSVLLSRRRMTSLSQSLLEFSISVEPQWNKCFELNVSASLLRPILNATDRLIDWWSLI